MSENLRRFIELLKSIFELDKSDLDFGIYRIMNIRKAEIEEFLSVGLPQKVKGILSPFAQSDREKILEQLSEIESGAKLFGVEDISSLPEGNPTALKYAALKKQLSEGYDLEALETDVYSALYSFFSRYYDEGDFISKRRYKDGVYAIPYDGGEVKLYWANQDQYYIKTSENFKDYTFMADGISVHFRLTDATTEQNNNKEQANGKRVFMLYTQTPERPELKTFEYNEAAGELTVRFVFDIPEDRKRKYEEENYAAIAAYIISLRRAELNALLAPVGSGRGKTVISLLEKHLKSYVAKNTFDYFIHKDLRSFLYRELDFYIKNEIMHLDDLDTENELHTGAYLSKLRAVKRTGSLIIDFLSQIESFQKKLWLKKKFVVQADWCITLDMIDESFYPEIAANGEQMDEWLAMYAVDDIPCGASTPGWTNPPSLDFLRQNPSLIIDTKFFSSDFKDRLVASIDDLDEHTCGLLVNSDNFQALEALSCRYAQQVQCIYIDPPYNTDSSKILYKNNYEHSSWLAMMSDRMEAGRAFLNETGIQVTAIDEYELKELYFLMQDMFGRELNAGVIAIRINPSGRPRDGGFALSHEYALVFRNSESARIAKLDRSEEQAKRYDKTDEQGVYEQRNFRREGSNSDRANGIRQWYPIYVNNATLQIRVPDMSWNTGTELWDVSEPPAKDETAVYPVTDDGVEKNWRWAWENVKKDYSQFYAIRQKSGIQVYYKFRPNESGVSPLTFWDDKRYSSTENGTKLLKDILPGNQFSYPKSIYAVEDMLRITGLKGSSGTVLDYFAGSATTGHAVVNLNRRDGGMRKYILVEMGEYFDTVTKPRMKKAIYSDGWKNGKPKNRSSGVSHIMKYMRLESYEDALSNIELSGDTSGMISLFGDDYLINYMIDIESSGSLLNIDAFKTPFDYRMKITEKNESLERRIDLCETFNYLIGLAVSHQSAIAYFRTTPAAAPAYEGAVDLASDINGSYAFRQIDGHLPDGRRALIIWRTVTGDVLESNAALDAYFQAYRSRVPDMKFDVVFVNGDSNLENLRSASESWKVQIIETEFKKRMFEEV